jgi:hypothetical protein
MNFGILIRTSLIGSPGFSRIGLALQYAAVSAGIHRLKPGFQVISYPDYFFKLHQAIPGRPHRLKAARRSVNRSSPILNDS